jgi:hypothetical protein
MDDTVNLGQCPNCTSLVPLQETDTDLIFSCPICLKKCKQYVNGKILYNKINFGFDEGEEYP